MGLVCIVPHPSTGWLNMRNECMKNWISFLWRLASIAIALWLSACSAAPAPIENRNPLLGDAKTYGFGVSQSKDDFANVEVAQLNFGMYKTRRSWEAILPNRGSTRYAALSYYYPFDMRWKLKDGREFIIENVDTAAVMREYLKTHQLLLQPQQEKRLRHPVGDYDPAIVVGVKDDTVVIKWQITMNRTPVEKRLPVMVNGKPAMDGTPWKLENEEYFVTALKGIPTSGIDFTKQYEVRK